LETQKSGNPGVVATHFEFKLDGEILRLTLFTFLEIIQNLFNYFSALGHRLLNGFDF
jgi:hypothetical protein